MTEQEGFAAAISDRDNIIRRMADDIEEYQLLAKAVQIGHKAELDGWRQAHDEQVTKLLEIAASRDEYQREADNMAAAHKVERDALTAERDALTAELELARMKTYCASISDIAKERDALKEAAKLALDALKTCETVENRHVRYSTYDIGVTGKAITALKAVL